MIVNYHNIKNKIKPLDLILFSGSSLSSMIIKKLSKIFRGDGNWSHCGMILTTDVVPIKNGKHGVLYVLESHIDENVVDVESNSFIKGVQIREFDEVFKHYYVPNKTKIAWCKLKNNILYNDDKLNNTKVQILQHIYKKFIHMPYDYSTFKVSFILATCFYLNSEHKEYKSIFCSELIALIQKKIGLIPNDVNVRNIVPADFILSTNKNKMPKIFDDPIIII